MKKMPTIGNLHSIRRACLSRLGIQTREPLRRYLIS
jgi:hypothetical protein